MRHLPTILFVLGVGLMVYGYLQRLNCPSPSDASTASASYSSRTGNSTAKPIVVSNSQRESRLAHHARSPRESSVAAAKRDATLHPLNAVVRIPTATKGDGSSNDSVANANPRKDASAYDMNDMNLLERAAQEAQEEGSRIAYIGSVEELYAFEPKFFRTKEEFPKMVESVEIIDGPQGKRKLVVQRKPIPVPTETTPNYQSWHRAILYAVETGAKIINLASGRIDRDELQSSISFARSRGVVVLTVPPRVR